MRLFVRSIGICFLWLVLIANILACKDESFSHPEPNKPSNKTIVVEKEPLKDVEAAPSAEVLDPPPVPANQFENNRGHTTGGGGGENAGIDYKGGSQGHKEPERVGNHDDERKHEKHHGFCGDGHRDPDEQCDPLEPDLPPGTGCTNACMLIEINCEDGVDNDQNGHIDCADSNCQGKPCTDHNACTKDTVCGIIDSEPVCITIPRSELPIADGGCEDNNECTTNNCIIRGHDEDDYQCQNILDQNKTGFGDCTPDGLFDNCREGDRREDGSCPYEDILDKCLIGKCLEIRDHIFCHGEQKELVPREAGCLDQDACTADSCIKETGGCHYEALTGPICESDGNPCTKGICQIAGNGSKEAPFFVECSETIPLNPPPPLPLLVKDTESCQIKTCDLETGICTPVDDEEMCLMQTNQFGELNGPYGDDCIIDKYVTSCTGSSPSDICSSPCVLGHYLCVDGVEQDGQNGTNTFCVPNDPDQIGCPKVFVTSQSWEGDLMSEPGLSTRALSNGDDHCRDLAKAAGLPGNFVAWLSDSTQNAKDRLTSNGPWYLVDGTLVASSHAALLNAANVPLNNPIDKTEINTSPSTIFVWTGTKANGTADNIKGNCSDWTSTSTSVNGTNGRPDNAEPDWTDNDFMNCAESLGLYCFQND